MSEQMNNEYQPEKKNNPLAIAALVLAILALLAPWALMGIPSIVLGIAGLIMAIVAKKQGATGGVVTAAIIISIIALVLAGIFLVACLACAAAGNALEGNLEGFAEELDRVVSESLADLT